jgi:YceI-like domain
LSVKPLAAFFLILFALLALAPPPAVRQTNAAGDTHWALEQSTLTYHVSHPLHEVDGVSHAAQGSGVCHAGQCDFSITAPVNSFDSGNGRRDRKMLDVTRAAQFPTITVRTHLPEDALGSATIQADIEIDFAGQNAKYAQVAFQLVTQDAETHITGTIPATLSDFKLDPPTLLGIALRNAMPVRVDMTWKRAD